MPFIECCNQKRSCDAYKLDNLPGLILNYAYYLKACPICGHTVLILRRYLPDGKVSEVRKTNEQARKLFDKVRPTIMYKVTQIQSNQGSSFFLRYGEFGRIKKCYSNISSLQMGKFDGVGEDLPLIPRKLPV